MSPVRRHFWHVVARVNSSLNLPRKWSLNWFMPGGREQHGRVPARHEHVARLAHAALGLKELQVFLANLVGFHDVNSKSKTVGITHDTGRLVERPDEQERPAAITLPAV